MRNNQWKIIKDQVPLGEEITSVVSKLTISKINSFIKCTQFTWFNILVYLKIMVQIHDFWMPLDEKYIL